MTPAPTAGHDVGVRDAPAGSRLPAPAIPVPRDAIAAFCRRHGIRRLALFGSVLRSDFDPARSDVDVLVEFEAEARIGLFGFVALQEELGRLLGRRVDLGTPEDLSRHVREDVLASAEVVYAAAR